MKWKITNLQNKGLHIFQPTLIAKALQSAVLQDSSPRKSPFLTKPDFDEHNSSLHFFKYRRNHTISIVTKKYSISSWQNLPLHGFCNILTSPLRYFAMPSAPNPTQTYSTSSISHENSWIALQTRPTQIHSGGNQRRWLFTRSESQVCFRLHSYQL